MTKTMDETKTAIQDMKERIAMAIVKDHPTEVMVAVALHEVLVALAQTNANVVEMMKKLSESEYDEGKALNS